MRPRRRTARIVPAFMFSTRQKNKHIRRFAFALAHSHSELWPHTTTMRALLRLACTESVRLTTGIGIIDGSRAVAVVPPKRRRRRRRRRRRQHRQPHAGYVEGGGWVVVDDVGGGAVAAAAVLVVVGCRDVRLAVAPFVAHCERGKRIAAATRISYMRARCHIQVYKHIRAHLQTAHEKPFVRPASGRSDTMARRTFAFAFAGHNANGPQLFAYAVAKCCTYQGVRRSTTYTWRQKLRWRQCGAVLRSATENEPSSRLFLAPRVRFLCLWHRRSTTSAFVGR